MDRYSYLPTLSGVFLLVALMMLTGCSGPGGNAENGARWYRMYNCHACHGENGDDGKAAQIAGLRMGFGSFLRILRKPNTASMPPFSEEKVSKKDAADIYTWLKNLDRG
ncbi:c-type cytochrome [Desulfosediminicola ganghwensis]|uniref:c-type cytochrome n=1 Tax=Desulfosediminicola ganghwensis TaxID=2569540 RepID=UPI0010ADA435|nr:cytochrome c [Desulfosediminicola ganghwensis]